MKVYKYPLGLDITHVPMPQGARVLCAQVQHGRIALWALVDPEKEEETRTFAVVGTGIEFPHDPVAHVGTMQFHMGTLVLHVFEVR